MGDEEDSDDESRPWYEWVADGIVELLSLI